MTELDVQICRCANVQMRGDVQLSQLKKDMQIT